MSKNFLTGGCSFTFGSELSDMAPLEQIPSEKSWAYQLFENSDADNFISSATPGSGNSGIARRVFEKINDSTDVVVVMWSFNSRYDWAMPRHANLENTRWATISPWDTDAGNEEAFRTISGSEAEQHWLLTRREKFKEAGVKDFAEAIYKYAANEYHELYLGWKSIIWLQNILEKKKIKYFFTLADNSLFYREMEQHQHTDKFLSKLYSEIDFSKWFSFGERMMGFNQWALLNDYPRGTTHPLDEAHRDAVQLMLPTFNKLIGDR